VVDGKQPSGKTKALYDSAVQKLLDEVGLSLLDAANKSEWHNITRPEALAAQARAASGFSAEVVAKRPSTVTKGAASSTSRAAGASVTASATCKPESRRNLKPNKPAIQISDADRKRKIVITVKCTMAFKKWREKGESFRVDPLRHSEHAHLLSDIEKLTLPILGTMFPFWSPTEDLVCQLEATST